MKYESRSSPSFGCSSQGFGRSTSFTFFHAAGHQGRLVNSQQKEEKRELHGSVLRIESSIEKPIESPRHERCLRMFWEMLMGDMT